MPTAHFKPPDYDRVYNTPGSPPLPAPDTEVELPQRSLNEEEVGFLDLNPDLEARRTNDATALSPSPSASRRLSVTQQSKFINYVDEQLMEVRRKTIKLLGMNQYSTGEIIADYQQLCEFILLSLKGDDIDKKILFGQVDYLLTIAGDITDALDKLNFKGVSQDVLDLLKLLDTKFTKLLPLMKQTEVVRLVSLAERTRPSIVTAFERAQVTGYHDQLASVYEQVLENV
ncbi:unnamed protein product [Cyberlindnera jadinii]|uniref:Uncharacterized protein n=1 Tax=Cyberlindnera jadinii (strain ATCC 18201 / CBS 1600 / BCRC 20928 / JCM 3617 / NBRC 0987 / NRRL Y-1542) TaxID=983966 RepID=A0A0H5C6F7_CYBJN|nr:hypothetical protein CYBJADRAFT_167554 [Cyberlindnera jadinii NRRL Y-1542]ODV73514.1 hypothetical protein CYBJADRAFT_167554 [Cyberlindnera jadinii NRRL Y-1542]CEP23603.1 unnamed protein product [Cyberlindnera jadinii]